MILIVESGSTKTAWRLIKDPTSAYDSFLSAGINPYYETSAEIKTSQEKVLSGFIGVAIQAVYYYGTGVTGDAQREIIAEAFRPYFPSSCTLEIQNDLIAAARSLCGKEAGIACILGTGSNSGFWDGAQISAQIPPLGFWLGDEGSGGHLGKSLVLSYLHGHMPLELRTVFEKRFGELDRLTVLDKAYKQAFPNRWFASFSKFLFDHRKEAFCYSLIEESFESFITLYLKRYQEASIFHFTGSVAFYYSDILKKVMKKSGLKLGHISEGPMAGLCLYHKGEFWP
ncbi:N-acetylglucosamine kinase [Aquirufa sp. A-Brett2-W8]|jgi:N-acetylglucosamine kinase-like BadF-type ATPase